MKTYSLRSIRTNLNLTLEEASKLIGISSSTLFNYEHYKTVPDIDNIRKITDAYNVEYNEIRFLPNEKEKKLAVKNEK